MYVRVGYRTALAPAACSDERAVRRPCHSLDLVLVPLQAADLLPLGAHPASTGTAAQGLVLALPYDDCAVE